MHLIIKVTSSQACLQQMAPAALNTQTQAGRWQAALRLTAQLQSTDSHRMFYCLLPTSVFFQSTCPAFLWPLILSRPILISR